LQGMAEAFQGVFRRWSPCVQVCHGFSFTRPSSKVPAEEGVELQNVPFNRPKA
jgi:hypothetical protein